MKLSEVSDAIKRFNIEADPGGECEAWQYFVVQTYTLFDIFPWSDDARSCDVDEEFEEYWLAVAAGKTDHFDKYGDLQ